MGEEKYKQQETQSNTEFDTGQLIPQGRHLLPPMLGSSMCSYKFLENSFNVKASGFKPVLP